ncbi:MAG TPA: hypothetical protein VD884_03815 [Ohtaekwangia sp.]|nr:hypothetical protein [Ohtaekwangia sp.]
MLFRHFWRHLIKSLFQRKTIGTLYFTLLLFGFTVAQGQSDIAKIIFKTASRGYQGSIIFTSDSIIRREASGTIQPKIKSISNTSQQWNNMVSLLENLDITNIGSLQSASKNRAVDAAHHSSIIITTAVGNSYQHNFDNEEPHPKLKALMEQISLYWRKSAE